jgi:excisionase family DNA binding protein
MEHIEKVVLTVEEAAAFTGFSKNYLYKLIHLRKIPHFKPMKGRVFFRPAELEAFLFRNRQGADYEGGSHA